MRYLVKRIPSTSLVQYDGSRYYCEIAGGTAEKATVDTTGLLAGSKYLDVQTGTWYVYDELTNAWAISAEGGSADPAVVEAAVEAWLDAHPEATTTVQDGSITYAKLDTTLKGKADAVATLSDEIDGIDSDVTDLKSAFVITQNNAVDQFAENPILNRNSSTDVKLNPDRIYIITEKLTNIGYKLIRLYQGTRAASTTLYILKKNGDNYEIITRYTATPIDNIVTFENIITGKDCYIAFSGTNAYSRADYSYKPETLTGFLSAIDNNIINTSSMTTATWSANCTITVYEKTYIDPDDFDGTDNEKIQSAFDAVASNGGVIKIKRKYVLTETINISHVYSANHRIYVIGENNAHIVINAYGKGFCGTAGNTGGVIFRDIKFTGASNARLIIPGTGTLGQEGHKATVGITFEDCVISNMGYIVEGNHYLQSFNLIRCTIREITTGINTNGQILYGLNIVNCIIEACGTLAFVYSPEACNIINNIIEGMSGTPINIRSASTGSIRIEGNYFEANNAAGDKPGLSISLLSMASDRARNIRIVSNYFYSSGWCIELPQTGLPKTTNLCGITIMNNSVLGNGTLVKGNSEETYNEVLCLNNSGVITDLPSTSLKTLSAFDIVKVLDIT